MSQVWSEQSYGSRIRQSASTAISNTTAESDLVNVAIPAGILGTNKVIKFTSTSLVTTPALSLPTLTIRVRFGNSIAVTTSALSLAISQTNTPFTVSGSISLNDATNSQTAIGAFNQPSSNVPLVLNTTLQTTNLTEDTTVALAFRITAQFGTLSSTTSIQHNFSEIIIS